MRTLEPGRPLRIVIVDDDECCLHLLRETMQTLVGASEQEIVTCGTSEQAKALIAVDPVRTVLVADVFLGRESGVELARWCANIYPGLPVLMMTVMPQSRVLDDCPNEVVAKTDPRWIERIQTLVPILQMQRTLNRINGMMASRKPTLA